MQDGERLEESPHVFLLGEASDIEKQPGGLRDLQPLASPGPIGNIRNKNPRVHPEVHLVNPLNPPCAQQARQDRAGHERAFETVVERLDILAADVVGDRDGNPSEKLGHRPDIGLGKMRVIKPDHRDIQASAGGDGFPRHLVGITGFDDVRALALERLLDEVQLGEGTVAASPRDKR